ncbi:MAG: hypothetical protein AB8H47_16310 [Bacteroidia bacterium]
MKPIKIVFSLLLCFGLSAQLLAKGSPTNTLQISGLNTSQSAAQKLSPFKEKRDLIIKAGLTTAKLVSRNGGTDTDYAGGYEFGFMTIKNKRLIRGFGLSYYTTQAGAVSVFDQVSNSENANTSFAGLKAPIFIGVSILNRDDLKLRAYGGAMVYVQTSVNENYAPRDNLTFSNVGYGYTFGAQFAWKLLLAEIYTERGLSDFLTNGTESYALSNITYSLGLRF